MVNRRPDLCTARHRLHVVLKRTDASRGRKKNASSDRVKREHHTVVRVTQEQTAVLYGDDDRQPVEPVVRRVFAPSARLLHRQHKRGGMRNSAAAAS